MPCRISARTIEGIPIHFIHQRGVGEEAVAAAHEPWMAVDVLGLSQGHRSAGRSSVLWRQIPQDSFDVVVPSLPGYGFSTPLPTTGIDAFRTADLWLKLMREVLGYSRFGAEGGDWGALISTQLGHKYPERWSGSTFI